VAWDHDIGGSNPSSPTKGDTAMPVDKIQNYFKVIKNADLIGRFNYLVYLLLIFPAQFTPEMAEELLYIIQNYKEDIEELAQAFIDSGEDITMIQENEWYNLEEIVMSYL
jgi:hypothetical protein